MMLHWYKFKMLEFNQQLEAGQVELLDSPASLYLNTLCHKLKIYAAIIPCPPVYVVTETETDGRRRQKHNAKKKKPEEQPLYLSSRSLQDRQRGRSRESVRRLNKRPETGRQETGERQETARQGTGLDAETVDADGALNIVGECKPRNIRNGSRNSSRKLTSEGVDRRRRQETDTWQGGSQTRLSESQTESSAKSCGVDLDRCTIETRDSDTRDCDIRDMETGDTETGDTETGDKETPAQDGWWIPYCTPTGAMYLFNKQTGQVSWDMDDVLHKQASAG
eukprot:Platyproteum_vivax@DN7233_c0_g1_i1.p1